MGFRRGPSPYTIGLTASREDRPSRRVDRPARPVPNLSVVRGWSHDSAGARFAAADVLVERRASLPLAADRAVGRSLRSASQGAATGLQRRQEVARPAGYGTRCDCSKALMDLEERGRKGSGQSSKVSRSTLGARRGRIYYAWADPEASAGMALYAKRMRSGNSARTVRIRSSRGVPPGQADARLPSSRGSRLGSEPSNRQRNVRAALLPQSFHHE